MVPAWRTPVFTGQALLYESGPVRRFAGLKLSGPLPGETTILNFRHLLERHSLGQGLPEKINAHLESQGLKLREGTIVDATIIEAPPSTKNRAGERDPEMHQTKKGNQRHLGMKAHMGVDSETGIVHSMSTTSANVHGVTEAHHLLHGGETVAWGDAGHQGVGKREENLGLEVERRVAMRPGRRQLDLGSGEALAEKAKASVRAKSLPPTTIGGGASLPEAEAVVWVCQEPAPLQSGVRCRGLARNAERPALLFGLGNLLTAEGQLMKGGVRPNPAGGRRQAKPVPRWTNHRAGHSPKRSPRMLVYPDVAPVNTTRLLPALFRVSLAISSRFLNTY